MPYSRVEVDLELGRQRLQRAARVVVGTYFARCTPRISRQEGRWEKANRWAGEALELRREPANRSARASTLALLASILADQGDLESAAAQLNEALEIGRELRSDTIVLHCLIEGAARLGWDPGAALEAWKNRKETLPSAREMETLFALWEMTGDESYVEAARETLAHVREHAPPEYRDTMIESVLLLYGRIHHGE